MALRETVLNKRFAIDVRILFERMDLSKKKFTGRERKLVTGSVVQVIGLPSVKIVQGLLFYHGLRFPRYLHQTIIVADATVQCFG